MYCRECGAKLPDGARFCGVCGTAVASAEKYDAEDVTATEEVSEVCFVRASCSSEDVKPSAVDVSDCPAGHRTLGSRLIEFRRTTLKAVSTFVLAILAFMVTAATAYAAFKVVTEVIIPAVEQMQESSKQRNSDDAGATDGTEDSDEDAMSVANKEAHAAYEQVLDDYRQLMAENADVIAAAGEFGTMIGEMAEYSEEQQAWVGDIYLAEDNRLYYAYFDIDDDSVDELFISVGDESGSLGGGFIFCGFDYADGEIIRFAESITRGSYRLVKDGLLVESGSGGFDTGILAASKWNGRELVIQDGVSWEPADDNNRGDPDSPYVLSTMKDGQTTEETVLWGAVGPARDAFNEKYSSAETLDWIMLE